jgi:hypothetical protein
MLGLLVASDNRDGLTACQLASSALHGCTPARATHGLPLPNPLREKQNCKPLYSQKKTKNKMLDRALKASPIC